MSSGEPDGLNTHPDTVYAVAPSVIREICWIAEASVSRPRGQEADREFWLRKAALLDRIALSETETYAPEVAAPAVTAAVEAAKRFVEYDAAHSGPTPRGAELATDADHRAHVREQYHDWSLTRLQ